MTATKGVKAGKDGATAAVAAKGKAKPKAAANPQRAAQEAVNEWQGKISQIGWDNERPVCMVAIDKADRTETNIPEHNIVRVQKVGSDAVVFAMVVKQFRAYVGQGKATVSTKLAADLGLTAADKIRFTNHGVLEAEADGFRQAMMAQVMAIRSAARTDVQPLGDPDVDDCDDPNEA
jgi:hypothetical protein